ncbi:MAG: SMP-30/gluconolactonase/LRE family protein [Chloroflexi bacterium]|nr:SMP-30/gluconolactonase/LRE family protein [Chloroflexota bacterium]MCH8869135.1 SMP-30/gluconolactonase/LRE family protein [Chloroflexota bacterium]MCH9039413.1 SMP-30/gluconolactonase/LRE family protein [Chloroflexota bacterium]
MQPELIADYQCKVGEGPMWHPLEKCVYWVDIPTGRMFRYDPATQDHRLFFEGPHIGGFTVQADGALLLFLEKGAIAILRNGALQYILDEIPAERETRFNDVIADPAGRVFCGTMPAPDHPSSLYRLDTDGSIRQVLGDIGISNGMGFTPDEKQMYYTDSPTHNIYLFDYEAKTGELSNQRVFVSTGDNDGIPDGMTVDAEGFVWSARWDGSSLVRYAPDGSQDRRVWFPARKVSSVVFGGEDMTDMYVTTAGGEDKDGEGPGAGGLYRINLGIKGRPEYLSRVRI